jgi:hypothetical protein
MLVLPGATHVAGIESNGKAAFWCGADGGKLRLVRKPRKPRKPG